MSKKMNEEEFNYKLNEYINRNRFWTEKTINQLGYSINLFTTLGIAFLAFLIRIKSHFPELSFSCSADFSFELTTYLISIILIFLSLSFGFISVLSRLFDFRVTRHLALSRKRYLARNKNKVINKNKEFGLIKSEIIDISNQRQIPIFIKYLKNKFDFIEEDDFSDSTFNKKFNTLRKDSKILGNLTWKYHKYQIILFSSSIIFYALTPLF